MRVSNGNESDREAERAHFQFSFQCQNLHSCECAERGHVTGQVHVAVSSGTVLCSCPVRIPTWTASVLTDIFVSFFKFNPNSSVL
jgi:hypothetical protein